MIGHPSLLHVIYVTGNMEQDDGYESDDTNKLLEYDIEKICAAKPGDAVPTASSVSRVTVPKKKKTKCTKKKRTTVTPSNSIAGRTRSKKHGGEKK